MRVLVVNPNTSPGATARIRAAAQAAARPGDRILTTCPSDGPELIVTPEDDARAARAVTETVRAHVEACDGIVLASFGDTGAAAVRALRPDLPVVGIASAAFATVQALGGPFGIVTFGSGLVPGLKAKVEEMRLGDRLTGIAHVADAVGDPGTVQDRFRPELIRLCLEMERRGAASIVMGGGPLAGFAADVAPCLRVPVIDGTAAAIAIMHTVLAGTAGRLPVPDTREASDAG